MPLLGFRMGVVDPAGKAHTRMRHRASGEREVLWRMQICPAHPAEGELGPDPREGEGSYVDIQRAAVAAAEVQAAFLEEGDLPFQRAIGVIRGGPGGYAVPFRQNTRDGHEVAGHPQILP